MKRILLIEDNDDIREDTSELLELEGYHVTTAADGESGLSQAREKMADLIVCDVLMTGISGYGVFEELHADPRTAAIPFIFMTANTESSDMKTGLAMGANAYIRKPFEPEELFEAIIQCLGTE